MNNRSDDLVRMPEDQTLGELSSLPEARESAAPGALIQISEKLHNALHHVQLDPSIVDTTREKIPEAMNGLDYVIEKTHEAANKTLDLVEDSLPRSAQLASRAGSLREEWHQLKRRELNMEQFKQLSENLDVFLSDVTSESKQISANLSEILLAQEFQDLTGQVIRRVMADVKAVDEQLGKFASQARSTGLEASESASRDEPRVRGLGPVINPCTENNFVPDQGAVDDLLADLDL